MILCRLCDLYLLILVGRALFSYFPVAQGGVAATISSFLFTMTEPLLAPIRRVVPPLGPFDTSFILVIFALQLLIKPALCSIG